MNIADMRSSIIASDSLTNDVANLRRVVESHPPDARDAEPDTKMWAFAGHQGRRVLVDRRAPTVPLTDNPTFTATSWRIGDRATTVNPVTGQHAYNTGNLYRTVHWTSDTFGLNGRFTNHLADAGMWRNDGLNVNVTRSKVLHDPTQWGTPKEQLSWM